ncbi:MAG: substrate-binding domain-containing protein [Bacteroidota bacterium]
MSWKSAWIPFLAILAGGCVEEKQETPTKGALHLLVSEAIAPVMKREVEEFLGIYAKNGATVTYDVTSSEEVIRGFLRDTIRCIVVTRALTASERELLADQKIEFTEVTIAYDALVAVVHYSNPIERITTPELRGIHTGTLKRWERLSHSQGASGPISPYLQDSSDLTSTLAERLLKGESLGAGIQRTPSNLQTLRSVVQNPLAIGLVDLDWLDSARVPAKVLEIAEPDVRADTTFPPPIESVGKFYSPHPAHLYRNYYPLKRTIRVYAKAPRGSLASGFVTFLAGREGQRIFLKRNLVPATQPVRLKAVE